MRLYLIFKNLSVSVCLNKSAMIHATEQNLFYLETESYEEKFQLKFHKKFSSHIFFPGPRKSLGRCGTRTRGLVTCLSKGQVVEKKLSSLFIQMHIECLDQKKNEYKMI